MYLRSIKDLYLRISLMIGKRKTKSTTLRVVLVRKKGAIINET